MSTVQGGPGNIVTNGLALYADAANPKSYPPPYNGTTWFDISGNNRNGTLINGPTYNSGNGGNFIFDGTDDDCRFNYTGSDSSPFTFGVWAKPQSSKTNIFIGRGRDGFGSGWNLLIAYNPSPSKFNLAVVAGGIQYNNITNNTYTANQWYYLLGTWEPNVGTKMYVNNVLDSTTSINQSTLRSSTLGWNVGNEGSGPYIATLSTYFIYPRILTLSEINQNFQATRARFGI
jgi:hypothetical protein